MKLDWTIWGTLGSFIRLEFAGDPENADEEYWRNELAVEGFVRANTYIGGFLVYTSRQHLHAIYEELCALARDNSDRVDLFREHILRPPHPCRIFIEADAQGLLHAVGSISPSAEPNQFEDSCSLQFRMRLDVERFSDSLFDLQTICKEFPPLPGGY